MHIYVRCSLVFISVSLCEGVSLDDQLQHILQAHSESRGGYTPARRHLLDLPEAQDVPHWRAELMSRWSDLSGRRGSEYQPYILSNLPQRPAFLGVPSYPSQLPEAEPILPGHTLLRPALGMLKSSLKFPHKELEDGFGVYGNYDNLGISYDGRNERLRYSTFRRSPSQYLMIEVPQQQNTPDSRYHVSPVHHHDTAGVWPAILSRLIQKSHNSRPPSPVRDLYLLDTPRHGLKESSRYSSRYTNNSPPDTYEDRISNNKMSGESSQLLSALFRVSEGARGGAGGGGHEPEVELELSPHAVEVDSIPTSMEPENSPSSIRTTTVKPSDTFSIMKNKDMFTRLKISPYAPSLKEVFPDRDHDLALYNANSNGRDYWFFVQDDFRPFNDKENEHTDQ